MVSYDDREEEQSHIDFDFSVFDQPELECPLAPPSEDEQMVVGSEMDIEEAESNYYEIATSKV